MPVEFDLEHRTLQLDPRAAAEATARGRFVWADVTLDDPNDDRARSREVLSSTLGLHIAANSSRASRALGAPDRDHGDLPADALFAVRFVRANLDWACMRRHRLL